MPTRSKPKLAPVTALAAAGIIGTAYAVQCHYEVTGVCCPANSPVGFTVISGCNPSSIQVFAATDWDGSFETQTQNQNSFANVTHNVECSGAAYDIDCHGNRNNIAFWQDQTFNYLEDTFSGACGQ